MAAIDVLDPSAVRRWCTGAVAALEAARAEIDDLNVYPVPDGDTGTNLLLTLRAADTAVRTDPPGDLAATLASMSRGAVLGARGNSGVILSQVLTGLAGSMADGTGRSLAGALDRAAALAWDAVAEPVEGTMLSVVKGAARAAGAAGDELAAVARAAAAGAARALERTPEQLPVLARAGVVDAGGRGLCLLLEALATVVGGDPVPLPRAPRGRPARETVRESGSDAYGYEVQYLLDAPDGAVSTLREDLGGLGDSLVVVGAGAGTWTVHVHVNDIGAAVEAGIRAGRPHRITVTRFADEPPADFRRPGTAVVAVAPGAGVAELFAAEGVLVADGTEDAVLDAVLTAGTAAAVVLPGRGELTALADAAADRARAAGVEVAVVPTRSPVQGLAAVAVHDQGRRFGDDVIAMAEAAAATRWAEVFPAGRDALTMAGPCRAGDVLGLVDGDVVLIGAELAPVAAELLERMLSGGGELVTLVLGGAEAALGAALGRQVGHDHPGVEVTVHTVPHPDVPLLVGVE
ncbi:MAG TPA: DAK2 domain-containing protein [Mycobacteriales bacterium]|nr:DAK2 domain-containing protein [Mycobacteriales bacterium]